MSNFIYQPESIKKMFRHNSFGPKLSLMSVCVALRITKYWLHTQSKTKHSRSWLLTCFQHLFRWYSADNFGSLISVGYLYWGTILMYVWHDTIYLALLYGCF